MLTPLQLLNMISCMIFFSLFAQCTAQTMDITNSLKLASNGLQTYRCSAQKFAPNFNYDEARKNALEIITDIFGANSIMQSSLGLIGRTKALYAGYPIVYYRSFCRINDSFACQNCLRDVVIAMNVICRYSIGAEFDTPFCNIRYENFIFV